VTQAVDEVTGFRWFDERRGSRGPGLATPPTPTAAPPLRGKGTHFHHFLPGATPCLQQSGGSTYAGCLKAPGGRLLIS
jgi:hypothetical protein